MTGDGEIAAHVSVLDLENHFEFDRHAGHSVNDANRQAVLAEDISQQFGSGIGDLGLLCEVRLCASETASFTTRLTLSKEPRCCRAFEITFSAAIFAASLPCSTLSPRPIFLTNIGVAPTVGACR